MKEGQYSYCVASWSLSIVTKFPNERHEDIVEYMCVTGIGIYIFTGIHIVIQCKWNRKLWRI